MHRTTISPTLYARHRLPSTNRIVFGPERTPSPDNYLTTNRTVFPLEPASSNEQDLVVVIPDLGLEPAINQKLSLEKKEGESYLFFKFVTFLI